MVRSPAAEEAAGSYVSLFSNSQILGIARYGEPGPGPAGTAMTVSFRPAGHAGLERACRQG